MAVVLRLTRTGLPGKASYRVVAAEKQKRRDGRFLEIIGAYYPTQTPAKCNLKEDRVKFWIERGARPSLSVRNLIRKAFPALFEKREEARLAKIRACRKARKARAKKK